MKKEFLIVLLAIGFIFTGAISASAATVTWTLIETAGMKLHSPGSDGVLGTIDDGLADKCNYSNVADCVTAGAPTQGSYSFSELHFAQDSSCALGTPGASCSTNADCGGLGCIDCNTPGKVGLTYFAKNSAGAAKGAGTYVTDACEGSYDITNVSIGTSEVITSFGGSCMTLNTFNSASGCDAGPSSTNYDLNLWTNSVFPNCGTNVGLMPGLALAGRIYAVGSVGTGICGYDTSEINAIASAAGLSSGYLSIMCGSGTLPTDLESACLPGADWESVIVAKAAGDVAGACASACGGCMAGAAEGVE